LRSWNRLKVARFVLSAPWWLPYEHEAEVGYHFRHYWETAPAFVDPILRLIEERQIDIVYSCSSPILHAALAAHVARRPHVQHMQICSAGRTSERRRHSAARSSPTG
jgi:hypothetical protein